MKKTHSYLIIILLDLLLIFVSQHKIPDISLQLGQSYSLDIPIIFKNYQQSTLQSFKNVERNYTQPTQICEIRIKQQGELTERVKLNYSSSMSAYNSNKVIYRLKDLQQSKIVIDSLTINQQIIALFPPNQIIVYAVNQQNRGIKLQREFKIKTESQNQLLSASFIEINNTVLLVSSQKIRKIHTNGSWLFIKGYRPVNSTITSLQFLEKKLYIGFGQQGLSIYQLDSTLTSVTHILKTQFFYSQTNRTVSFDVDEFQIHPTQTQVLPSAKSIYVLDYVQGLIQIRLDKIQHEKTLTTKPRFLASSCRNLILFWNSIYLTCPEIIEISKENYGVITMKETSFLSQNVRIQKDRLFLFGNQDFAVYDIFGKSLAQYQLPYQSELSTLVSGDLLTFGRENLRLHSIAPQKQQLYCFSNDPKRVGEYTGYIETGGMCKQFNGSNTLFKKTWEIYCLVDFPIRLYLKNSSQLNLKIELILLGAIVIVYVTLGLYLGLKHFIAHRSYSILNEEQFKQVKEVGSQLMGKKQVKQEIVNSV